MPGVCTTVSKTSSGAPTEHESLVNLPNWLPLTFRVDGGDWFDVEEVTLLAYRQSFDLRGAVLTRELRFRDDAGRTTAVTQTSIRGDARGPRGRARDDDRRGDSSGTIEIRSTLDGNVRNSLVERYRDLSSSHIRGMEKRELSENSVLLTVETRQSQIRVALAARTTLWHGDSPAPATYRW